MKFSQKFFGDNCKGCEWSNSRNEFTAAIAGACARKSLVGDFSIGCAIGKSRIISTPARQ